MTAETPILETRETKRSYGLVQGAIALLLLGLPFLGRQRITVTNERVTVTEGFWTKLRDDIEVFRIRDVVSRQSLWQRLFRIGDVVIKSTEGRTDEVHVLRGVPDPIAVSEAIRHAWNLNARPRTASNLDG
jgi:uncharacterized membrane protein YdbT with pleckstrin-like domain